ncbi:MAG: Sjogren's syndrome/scleroderma autoantigen 1 family protein [Conexivisphaerales archaeon]
MERKPQKLVVELMRKGATLLKEPCPKCGGILLRYKGREICPVDSGITSIEELEEVAKPKEDVSDEVIDISRNKLRQLIKMASSETDLERLRLILDNSMRLIEIIKEMESSKND